MKYKSIVILFFFLHSLFLYAINNNRYEEKEIKFSQSSLTVKQALDEICKLSEINVTYNVKESFLDLQLTLPTHSLTIQEALAIIQKQAPVDIIFNNNNITVKGRELNISYQLKGTVKDMNTNEILVAANVFIPGTKRGVVTGNDGQFSLQLAPGNYELEFRYIGYKTKRLIVNLFEDKTLNVLLKATKKEIGEVRIIGTFGEIENMDIGRPIEQIGSKTINQLNTNVVNDALHGRINGVWTTKVSGAPGDHSRIRIRGINSVFGSIDPLYVVDGMIIPIVNAKTLGISDLNTHDIESITVLKDASSTALYGFMGGNGVILVETKKGGGETKFNFNIKEGIQWFSKRYSLMNAEDFYNTLELSDKLINTPFYTVYPYARPPKYELYPYYRDSLGNTLGSDDFQEELFQRGSITEYQLSGQGSSKIINYYLSGNYFTHKGIVTNTQYDKYSFIANLSKIFGDKLSLRLLYKGSLQENKNNLDTYMGNPVIYKGINYEPGYRFTPDSFLRNSDRFYYNESLWRQGYTMQRLADHLYSPDMLFYGQSKTKTERSNAINSHGIYRITSDLSFHAGLSLAFKNIRYKSYLPGSRDPEKYLSSNEQFVIFNQQYDIRYEKLHNNHSISAFIRYRNYKDNAYWKVDSLMNIDLEGLKPEDNIYSRGSQAIFGEKGSVIRAINSTILNLNYSYKKKYSFSAIANFDHLREGHYIDEKKTFYSLAVDYDLSKEKILSIPAWINALHLCANIGHVGNYFLNSLSNDLYTTREYTANNQNSKAVFISNLANHYLKSEKVTEYNFGTDIALFKDRMILSGDYYMKYYNNLMVQRTIPYYYYAGRFFQNIGEMENKGFELSLEITPFERSDFFWTIKFGFASNNQVITKLYEGESINFNYDDVLFPDFYALENETLGDITGYKYQGIWDDSLHSENVSGDIKYIEFKKLAYLKLDTLDTNNITVDDKTIIGNSIPDFTCNWINIIRYKNFTCEMLWYAVIGVDKYNATRACTYITGTNSHVRQLVMDTMNFHCNNVFYESSYFVEDAGFIRLKTLSFRYHQPGKFFGKVDIEYSVSFENLVTLSRYSGYDPEASIYTNNNFSDNAIDKGSYPNPKGVYFSVNLGF